MADIKFQTVVPMTVADLKKILKVMPDKFQILLEGCDCTGTCFGAEVNREEKTVTLLRNT